MTSVAIVEDEKDIRTSLSLIINGSPGYTCVAAYPDCETAVLSIAQDDPEVLLMDIGFPPGKLSGIEGVRQLKQKLPSLDVIMLTVHDEPDLIFQSLQAGACGYLLKNTPPAKLLDEIREVRAGGAPMSSKIARLVVESFQRSARVPPLTERQKEVLQKLRAGKSYKIIGDELFISENTVKCHIKKIYEALHVHTQAEAIAKAMEQRLL